MKNSKGILLAINNTCNTEVHSSSNYFNLQRVIRTTDAAERVIAELRARLSATATGKRDAKIVSLRHDHRLRVSVRTEGSPNMSSKLYQLKNNDDCESAVEEVQVELARLMSKQIQIEHARLMSQQIGHQTKAEQCPALAATVPSTAAVESVTSDLAAIKDLHSPLVRLTLDMINLIVRHEQRELEKNMPMMG